MSELPIDMLDPKARKAIEMAEKQDGYSYGVQMHATRGQCFVSVSFYPTRQWFVTFRDNGERRQMTMELAKQISELKL